MITCMYLSQVNVSDKNLSFLDLLHVDLHHCMFECMNLFQQHCVQIFFKLKHYYC